MLTTKPKEKRKRQQWRLSPLGIIVGLPFEFLSSYPLGECAACLQKENHILTGRNRWWLVKVLPVDVSAISSEVYQYNFQREIGRGTYLTVSGTFSNWDSQSTLVKGKVRINLGTLFIYGIHILFLTAVSILFGIYGLLPLPLLILVGTGTMYFVVFIFAQNRLIQLMISALTE